MKLQNSLVPDVPFLSRGGWSVHSNSFIETSFERSTYHEIVDLALSVMTVAKEHAVEPSLLIQSGKITVQVPWVDAEAAAILGFAKALTAMTETESTLA